MNLTILAELNAEWMAFCQRHPKFPLFMNAVKNRAIEEGTIMEIKVTTPDGQTLNSNLKLTKEDLALIKRISK
ncbi:hypothetical protein AALB16_00065 [Lachnospiraceae bacterium 62-35]